MHRNGDTAARFFWGLDPSRHVAVGEHGSTGVTFGLLAAIATVLYVTGADSIECMCSDPQTVFLRSWRMVEGVAHQLTMLI